MRKKENRKMQLFEAANGISDGPRTAGYSARICPKPAAWPQLSPPVSGCSLLRCKGSRFDEVVLVRLPVVPNVL